MALLRIVLPDQLTGRSIREFLRNNQFFPATPVDGAEVDGTNSTWIEPAAIATITAACLYHFPNEGERHRAININLAQSRGFWQRMNFFRILGIPSTEDFIRHDPEGRFFPITVVDTLENLDEISQELSRVITDDQNLGLYIQHLVQELLWNAIDHGEWPKGALVTAQYYPSTQRVQVAIVDCGKGIMASLSEHGIFRPQSDQEALLLCLRPWVSGKGGQSRLDREEHGHVGCGLTIAAKLVQKTGGDMILLTGDATLIVPGSTTEPVNHWSGTVVVIELYRDRLRRFQDIMREILQELGAPPREGRFRFV